MPEKGRPTYKSSQVRLVRRLLMFLVFAAICLAGIVVWPVMQARMQSPEPVNSPASLTPDAATSTATPAPAATITPTLPSPSPSPSITPASLPANPWMAASPLAQGLIILAMDEGGYSHLFALQTQEAPFFRLTSGAWDDIDPALSPDGKQVAFASNRDGHWDLYLMDLSSGKVQRLTDSPEYDASPTFSPDGRWLAYETLVGDSSGEEGCLDCNLEIYIRPLEGDQEPIRLTDNPAADYDPVWSPQGRKIAFVSDRSGTSDIWIADLDRIDDRFQDISQNSDTRESHPAWSADGSQLSWASTAPDGLQSIVVSDGKLADQPESAQHTLSSGGWAAWSPKGPALVTALVTPNQNYLTGYDSQTQALLLPPLPLSGGVHGITWGNGDAAALASSFAPVAQQTPDPLWQPALTPAADIPNGRLRLVPLNNVDAPNPVLQDLVDESFQALRKRVAAAAGWDFLSSLQNAFVPLTSPLEPGMMNDWLYTGRAFAFNPLPINAGWVVVMRENFGAQTYWHVYVRTRFQDGSQGAPLTRLPWNFSARYDGDPQAYEQGGALAKAIPPGYWVDFTRLAAAYGWERLPALSTWRSAYPTTRFNEFVLPGQRDWHSAMLEIYPPMALYTPTSVPPTTQVPTATRWPTRTPVPTRTPWPTRTPTPSPTPRSPATLTPTPAP